MTFLPGPQSPPAKPAPRSAPAKRAGLALGCASALALAGLLALAGAPASAQTLSPWWGLTSSSRPTNLPAPGGEAQIVITAQNLGDATANGKVAPVLIEDHLPSGLQVVSVKAIAGESLFAKNRGPVSCTTKPLKCTFSTAEVENAKKEKEVVALTLRPYEQIEMQVKVLVGPSAESGEENSAVVSGGGAAGAASASQRIQVGGEATFGFEDYELLPESEGGSIDTQAGSHPFQLTSVVNFNTQTPDGEANPRTAALPKDVIAQLPPGLIGNPTPFAQCTDAQFAAEAPEMTNDCPASSAIGVATVSINEPSGLRYSTLSGPIFNMKPRVGEPARLGFKAGGIFPVFLDIALRAGSDYGVTATVSNLTEIGWPISAKLTIWGVPGDPRHDGQRGWECLQQFGSCPATTNGTPPPFLVMPTSCEEPYFSSIGGDSWGSAQHPGEVAPALEYRLPEAIDGCNHLPFSPSIKVTPDSSQASSPSGLNVDVHVNQEAVLNAQSLAQSAVKQITVALPQGMAVNPAGGDGLQACSEALVGYLPAQSSGQRSQFSPSVAEPFCPAAAKIGTVDIASPLLAPGQHLTGSVYLATQNENPFGSLLALYIVAEDPISGTILKQAGEVQLSETGQLTTTVKGVPQLAFEDAQLHFFGGERAPLATPDHCGLYTTKATFTPWSGNDPVVASSTFAIATGPHESACPPAALPFSPTLAAGSINIQAGALTPFTTTIGRADGEQNLSQVSLHMPPGLSGLLAGVALCPEAQANQGTCAPQSLIGHTTVSAGVGSDPVTVTGGRVYLTGPYRGAPFGLSIVNPVKAGPFDLENTPAQHPACDCIVVRARIEVDPHSAQLTVTTDKQGEPGALAIPHIIEGIPVQIRHVNVTIDREGFTFNPTNCSPLSILGTIASDQGASQALSLPFQATNCASLKFAPQFSVATAAKTSKANGASLSVSLSYPAGSFAKQANIASVKVDLPKQLPSRLTTLQKACLAATFEANPASCPGPSIVGHAKVTTPLLPVALEGPAYFVSHGNEAFPSLTIVLKGYGVTVDLIGQTFIRNGITSSTFKATPDVPFNTFELTLPQGPYSALAANGNLCAPTTTTSKRQRVSVRRGGRSVRVLKTVKSTVATALLMPTAFVAQNGAELHQNTKIAVTGCPKAKKAGAQAKKKGASKKGKRR